MKLVVFFQFFTSLVCHLFFICWIIPLPTPNLPILITSFISRPSFRRYFSFSGGIESILGGREGVITSVMPGTGPGAEATATKGRWGSPVHRGVNEDLRKFETWFTIVCGSCSRLGVASKLDNMVAILKFEMLLNYQDFFKTVIQRGFLGGWVSWGLSYSTIIKIKDNQGRNPMNF